MSNPKLRFMREDGTSYPEWNRKSFSNTFSPLNNNTFSRDMLSENGTVCNIHYGDILVKFGEVCDIQTTDIPRVNADIDTSKFDKLQDGDIILADTAEDETVGKATEIYCVGTSKVISGLHTMACRPNEKYAPKYLGYYINSPTYHNQLIPFMQGIKVTSIGRKNIADTVIYYPADIEEQQKIADFLSSVDEVIAQSEAEVSNLQQQKKAAMQKIFSQEVRFKRDDGTEFPEWEEDSVFNVFGKVSSGKTKPDINGSFPLYGSMGIIGRCLTANYKGKKLLIARVGANAGTINYVEEDCGVTDNTLVICSEIKNLKYFYYALQDYDLGKMVTGSGQPLITGSGVQNVVLFLPCLEEQQKIADFLSAYDEAIDYAKQEFDKWKELKKGLLQQMFV